MNEIRYVVITPARDEEAHIGETIQSMANQTIRPVEWIIVNDGSTDKTGEIIDQAAAKYSWIRPLHRGNRGFRKAGGGVVEAFDFGLKSKKTPDWHYIVKLDGDLSFDPTYFEECFRRFEENPKLGVAGGTICYVENGKKVFEVNPTFHVRGATKIYRRECWEAIGGFWPAPGWDTYDEVKANRLGWTSQTFPELHLVHHRHTGAADGQWKNLVKNGRANYVCGYHPLFMISKCAVRLLKTPVLMGSVALMYGFLSGYWKGIPQVDDTETIRYLRQQQFNRLIGKPSIWK